MLSHENVIANVSAVLMQLGEHRVHRHDVMMSFLPLAHMLEHCCQVLSTSSAWKKYIFYPSFSSIELYFRLQCICKEALLDFTPETSDI